MGWYGTDNTPSLVEARIMNDRPPTWRELTDAEKRVLDRLLSIAFVGRAELAVQANCASVSRIDREGSLQFRTVGPFAPVRQRVPVGGRYRDGSDDPLGPVVNLLLHVVDGRLHELEIYKDDGSGIVVGPFEVPLEQIVVWTNP
jgi:hypothetical protein